MGIPSGFNAVEKQSYARTHDFRDEPILQGTVKGFRNVPQKGRTVRVMEVAKVDGELVSVWQNSMMQKLFASAAVGDEVYVEVEYTGDGNESEKQKIVGYQTAVKKAKKK